MDELTEAGTTEIHLAIWENNLEKIKHYIQNNGNVNIPSSCGVYPLHLACFLNRNDMIKLLINNSADLKVKDNNQTTCLHWAVNHKNVEIVKLLLERTCDIDAADINGIQPLHLAAVSGSSEIVKLLCENGALIVCSDKQEIQPLHLASFAGHVDVTKTILDIDNSHVNNGPITPINLAASCNHRKVVEVLLESGACNYSTDPNGVHPINWAATCGNLHLVKLLLDDPIFPNFEDAHFRTPLFLATVYGHTEVVIFLLKNGGSILPESGTYGKYTLLSNYGGFKEIIDTCTLNADAYKYLLHWGAAFLCRTEFIRLLNTGLNINEFDEKHNSAMHIAAAFNNVEVLRALEEKNMRLDIGDEDDHTALHWAAYHGHMDSVKFLLDNRANISMALHFAAENSQLELIQFLLDEGASINEEDDDSEYSCTPLRRAAMNGHEEAVKLLLDNGANNNDMDIIHWLAGYGFCDTVEMLLERGVDVDESDLGFNRTALHWAAHEGQTDMISLLLDHGANPQMFEDQGDQPIHYAVLNNHVTAVEILAKNGADLDHRGDVGTPLCLAAQKGHEEIVNILIDAGADINTANFDVNTPVVIAMERGHLKIVKLLLQKGAKYGVLLHTAVRCENMEIVKYLVKLGADINEPDDLDRPPIFIALKLDFQNVFCELLNLGANLRCRNTAGANIVHELGRTLKYKDEAVKLIFLNCEDLINVPDSRGATPIYSAIEYRYIENLNLLLDRGANVNHQNENGDSPLHLAIQNNANDIAIILIEKGANFELVNSQGMSAIHYAIFKETSVTLELLLKKGAKINKVVNGMTPLTMAVLQQNRAGVLILIRNGGTLCPEATRKCPLNDLPLTKMLVYAGCLPRMQYRKPSNVDVYRFLIYFIQNPLTLRQLSRIAIRKRLKTFNALETKLPLPLTLIEYVKFENNLDETF